MAGINYGSKEHIALGAGLAGATMFCVYHPPPSKPGSNNHGMYPVLLLLPQGLVALSAVLPGVLEMLGWG